VTGSTALGDWIKAVDFSTVYPPERLYPPLHPDIAARGNDDPRVSVREPFPGVFLWSWCAYGVRQWRERAGRVGA
jgi:hypothetical protein